MNKGGIKGVEVELLYTELCGDRIVEGQQQKQKNQSKGCLSRPRKTELWLEQGNSGRGGKWSAEECILKIELPRAM
jgi:hypothetical protein